MKKKILITLPTGKTGFAAAKELLEEGYPVRIYTRSRSERALKLEKLGAEIAIGEFNSKNQLLQALKDIDTVYYCYPIKKGLSDDVNLFIQAAKERHIEAVIFMGQRIAEFPDTGSLMTNETRKAYQSLENSGLNVVYFIPGYFADNAFVVTEFVLQLGLMANPFGSGKNPWISNGDMGRCIAVLLKNPQPYYGQRLFPTGPQSINAKEIASVFSKVSGRGVKVVNAPEWLFLKAGIMLGKHFGFDAFAILQAVFYNRQMRMHRFDIVPTEVVKQLTGREPEDFESITRQYFEGSPYRKRNLANWFSAFKKFMMMPLTPVPSKKELLALNNSAVHTS